jgi:hypothetical protein
MAKKRKINIGDKYGRLTILREVNPHITPCGTKQRMVECKCDCGNIVLRRIIYLNNSSSCNKGKCFFKSEQKILSRAIRKSFLYSTWSGMKQRCYDENSTSYKNYGAKSIGICEDWKIYENFYNWAIHNGASKDMTIDRIDPNGNYEPNNCRWADIYTQANNKKTNRKITYKNETLNVCQWAERRGIDESIIRSRIDRYGYSIGEALGYEKHTIIMPQRPKCRKHILQYSINGDYIKEWNSLNEIEENLHINTKSVRDCCCGRQMTAKGFKWKWKEQTITNNKSHVLRKKVYQYDSNWNIINEFSSAADASLLLKCDYSRIIKICSKKSNSICGGCHWSYEKLK